MCYLSIVVVSRAVLLLHVLPTSREEGQRVEVLMWGLFAAGHQLALVEQIRCVAAATGSKLHSQHWLLHKGHSTGFNIILHKLDKTDHSIHLLAVFTVTAYVLFDNSLKNVIKTGIRNTGNKGDGIKKNIYFFEMRAHGSCLVLNLKSHSKQFIKHSHKTISIHFTHFMHCLTSILNWRKSAAAQCM